MDIGANFKITAGVVGQAAVDKLNAGVGTLNAGIGRLPGLAKTAGLAMAGLGAGLSVVVLKEKFDGVVESILKVKDASERLSSTVEKTGALVQIAKITGDDFGQIEGGIIKMTKALAGSDDEAKGAAHALDAIGLSIKELRQLDPADAFGKVATALDGFEDGAGKSAVAMQIFGKNGAQLLPFLKDYVELSDTVSKVTVEQAESADRYDRALRRLEATKQDLYKVISVQMLPVAEAFVGSLLEVTNGTNGVKEAAKGLAKDGTMTMVFREAARAASALLDVVSVLGRALSQVGDSFGAVYQDLRVAASWPGLFASDERKAEFAKVVAERDAYVQAANKRLADRLDQGLTPFTDALERQFAKQDEAAKSPAPPAPKKPTLNGFTSREPTGPKGADPYTTDMQSLGRDAAKLQFQIDNLARYGEALDSAKEAQVRFDIEQGKFKDLSEKQKTLLLFQASAVDTLAERLKVAKVEAEVDKQTKALDANTASLGLNTRERELAAFAQELETKGVKAGTEAYERLMAARRAALGRKDAANDDVFLGLRRGLNDIADQAKGTGEVMKDALTSAFDQSADAFAEFVTKGKLDFKEFARSVLADLAKMIIKQALFNAVKAGLNSFGGGTAAAANGAYFDSRAGVAAFAMGGVVNSPTPFRFAAGGQFRNGLMGEAGPEAIMPLKRGRDGKLGVAAAGGGGGGVSIGSLVVNAEGSSANMTEGRNADQLGKAIGAAVQAEIIRQQRPGGLLAA